MDCVGVPVCVCRDLGLVAPDWDVPPYRQTPDGHTMIEWCERYMTPIPSSKMQAGDAIVTASDEHPQHLGILGNYAHGGFSIIHACNSLSCVPARVIETRLMFSRINRFVAAYALPGIA
jgi:hypothetical protein